MDRQKKKHYCQKGESAVERARKNMNTNYKSENKNKQFLNRKSTQVLAVLLTALMLFTFIPMIGMGQQDSLNPLADNAYASSNPMPPGLADINYPGRGDYTAKWASDWATNGLKGSNDIDFSGATKIALPHDPADPLRLVHSSQGSSYVNFDYICLQKDGSGGGTLYFFVSAKPNNGGHQVKCVDVYLSGSSTPVESNNYIDWSNGANDNSNIVYYIVMPVKIDDLSKVDSFQIMGHTKNLNIPNGSGSKPFKLSLPTPEPITDPETDPETDPITDPITDPDIEMLSVKFEAGAHGDFGPGSKIADFEVEAGSDFDFDKVPVVHPEFGYVFTGWDKGIPKTINENLTIKALYEKAPTQVIYKENGGLGFMPVQDGLFDTNMNLLPNMFTMTGHSFNGWNTNADGSGLYFCDEDMFKPLDLSTSLFAQWIPIDYTVSYNVDGDAATVVDADNPYHLGDDVTVIPDIPTKTGYYFNGWSYGGSIYNADETFVMPASDVTLVALWTLRTDLSYKVNYLELGSDKELAESKEVMNQTFGELVEENAISITGYNMVAPTDVSITIEEENNVINFYYAGRTDLGYVVNYLEKGTNKVLATQKVILGQKLVASVDETAVEIDGYTALAPTNQTVHISLQVEDINFYYTPEPENDGIIDEIIDNGINGEIIDGGINDDGDNVINSSGIDGNNGGNIIGSGISQLFSENVISALASLGSDPAPEAQVTSEPEVSTSEVSTSEVSTSEGQNIARDTSIADSSTPKSAWIQNSWSLMNLILTIMTALIMLMLMLGLRSGRRDENDSEKVNKHLVLRLCTVLTTLGAAILFIMTQDMSLPMVWADQLTIWHGAIVAVTLVIAFFSRKNNEEKAVEAQV